MEPNYNDPNYWTRWYAEQHELQRAREESDDMPANQTGFEQQLTNLQLSSPEESSSDRSSPDIRPTEPHEIVTRTESMRTPPRFNLRDDAFGSMRRSVDVPRAYPGGSAAGESYLDLRDRPFKSTRYTAPSEPEPAAQTKDRKSRGLWSRVKSGVGNAFGGNRRNKSSGTAAPDEVHKELRMDFVKRSRPAGELYPEDEQCISQFGEAVRDYEILPDGSIGRGDGRVPEGTIRPNLAYVRRFARWLRAEDRNPLASRLFNDPESLAADIEDYRASGGDDDDRLKSALSHLRRIAPDGRELQAVGPGPRLMGLGIHHPYPDDARIIDGLANEELSMLGPDSTYQNRRRVTWNASARRRFSDWLRREGRGSIASRLNGSDQQQRSLKNDYRDFTKTVGKADMNLDRLRQYLGAESEVKELHPYPDDALIIDGLVNEELSKLGAGSATQRRVATNTARHQRRFSDWLQTRGRESIASRLNGDDEQKWSLKKDYQDFSEAVGKRSVALKRLGQYLQVVQANAAFGEAREQASGAGPADPDTPSRSDQPAGSEPTRPPQHVDQPIQDRSGASLGATQWLGDEHIHRDYGLLAQELLQSNPDLAIRTRFVDPLIATQLLHFEASDALRAFHRIVNDRTTGYDTADFLFLPVNDASPADLNRRGNHWSLLFVVRRDRSGPLAYHYDSAGRHNESLANQLAARLGAHFESALMAQQRNGRDCGVYVLDGTRALVSRLAEGLWPAAVPLDSLVIDREQLRRRLSAAPSEPRAAAAADRPGPSIRSVDSAEFWHGVDQAGQPPSDSWNTASFWRDVPIPDHSPVQSVDQPSPSWEQSVGESIFGARQYMPPPVQDLGGFVPSTWQHRNQRAPENLMRGMHWYNVLPSAGRPQTNFTIHGVLYTATLGPSGKQNDIHVFQQ